MAELASFNRDLAARQRARALHRSLAAFLFCEAKGGHLVTEAENLFPKDKELLTLVRAAVTPMATTSDGAMFAINVVSEAISVLSGVSAGAKLLGSGLKVQLDTSYGVIIPLIPVSANNVGWIGEGAPIPLGQLALDESNALVPHKMSTIVAATRELFDRSIPTFENIIRAAYYESLQLALDATVLGTAAGDTVKSAGLRYNISALPASVNADPVLAMMEDVKTVVSAVATVAANSEIVLVSSPTGAVMLRSWRERVPYTIYGSTAVADGDLIAVATNAIASSIDEIPKFETSREATLHMNTAPLPISAVGTPNTVAAPVRSLFQTDSVGCKITLGASWILRSTSGVAWTTGGSW